MERVLPLILLLFSSACSGAPNNTEKAPEQFVPTPPERCRVTFSGLGECHTVIDQTPVTIELDRSAPEYGERTLEQLTVTVGEHVQQLPITEHTVMLESDQGYLAFQDINFDGHRDLALTTSFSTANLYLDYWRYDPEQQRFEPVGNYPQLTPVPGKQQLQSTIRHSAERHENTRWHWQGHRLIPVSPE